MQEEYIPVTKSVDSNKPKWFDKEVREVLKQKQGAWRRYLACKTLANFEKYKLCRKKFKTVSREARRLFKQKIAFEAKDKPKSFWNYVGRKTKQSTNLQKVKNKDGLLTNSNLETACCLNQYFASVFTNENAIDAAVCNVTEESLEDISFDHDTILYILKNLKVDKAPGPDGILPRVLLEAKEELVLPFSIVFEKSLNESHVPKDWKDAIVVPIHKKGKKDLPGNYRPVSLTSIICKIMERMVRDSIMQFLDINGLLSEEQFGFIPGRSCVLQLLVCLEDWTSQLDAGAEVDIIYTDFSKAFNTVSHEKLIMKLYSLGIKGRVLQWISDFLRNRRQRVRVCDSLSHWESVTSGVPQGSVLGPVLFVAYINDLSSFVQKGIIRLFADDAKLCKAITSDQDYLELQRNLNLLNVWSRK